MMRKPLRIWRCATPSCCDRQRRLPYQLCVAALPPGGPITSIGSPPPARPPPHPPPRARRRPPPAAPPPPPPGAGPPSPPASARVFSPTAPPVAGGVRDGV